MTFFKNISLITTLLLAVFSVSPCLGREMRVDISQEARSSVSEEKLALDIDFLTDSICAGRATGSIGSSEASSWISRRFASLGLSPAGDGFIHGFRVNGTNGRNVIGIVKGCANRKADKYIIIAASYDGLGIRGGKYYPGADSNASGVAAMLGVARMISVCRSLGREYGADIIFAALDGKYQSLAGSNALWNQISSGSLKDADGRPVTPGKIKVMVNLDQIGSSLSPLASGRKDYLIMLGGGFGSEEALQANKSNDTGLELSFSYYGSSDFTNVFYRKTGDHTIFLSHGVKSVLFTSGITMNNNKLTDTPDNLDFPVLKRRVYLVWNWTERIAGIKSGKQNNTAR